jgi:hypothetical protein
VTDLESQELTSQVVSSQTTATPSNQERIQGLLMHKQQMALGAYLNFMKSQIPVTIDEKIL